MQQRMTRYSRPALLCLALLAAASVAGAQSTSTSPPPSGQNAQDPATPPTVAITVTVVGTTPLGDVVIPVDCLPAPVQTGDRAATSSSSGALDLVRLPEPPPERRARQRDAEQPVSARRQLSRLHRVAAARHAAGPVGLHGRRPPQSAVRRRRELGSDSAHRDRVDDADAGIESAVRAEHARRRAVDSDQGRPFDTRAPRCRRLTAATCGARVEFEHGGSTAADG